MNEVVDWDGTDFDGAKLALLSRGRVLTLLRDDRPDIAFPNMWDLPGGGREIGETPQECVLRELDEEMGLRLTMQTLTWGRPFEPDLPGQAQAWFFGAQMPDLKPADITFGDEGQMWRLMPVRLFVMNPKTIPHMARRLGVYLEYLRQAG
jgi:8-oxo-dGTP diphosphatase